ncbi:MAG: alpha/beta hydrolase [Thaumarchaeota archaeon]|nr:alpha/beta hydrolase [Nitrososphaerota archaeon]
MAFLNVKGGKIYYETAGMGKPLVMIHAGFLDSRMWDEQFRIFSRENTVVRYDVRGYGRSNRPSAAFSDYEDLTALLDHLNFDKTCILGVSNGGRIALDFATVHPERVGGLILVSPGIRGYKGSGPEEDKLWEEDDKKFQEQERALKDGRVEEATRMDLDIWAPAQNPSTREWLWKIASENSDAYRNPPNNLQKSPDTPPFERLSAIKAPTLILVGDRDLKGMQAIARGISKRIPGSELTIIAGADHIANTSRPEVFNELVGSFLKKF